MIEQIQQHAAKVPGPGTYEHDPTLAGFHSTFRRGSSTGMAEAKVKSQLDLEMDRAKELPGPGAACPRPAQMPRGVLACLLWLACWPAGRAGPAFRRAPRASAVGGGAPRALHLAAAV